MLALPPTAPLRSRGQHLARSPACEVAPVPGRQLGRLAGLGLPAPRSQCHVPVEAIPGRDVYVRVSVLGQLTALVSPKKNREPPWQCLV